MEQSLFMRFLLHKVTLIVAGVAAVTIVGVSVLTKAMNVAVPDAVVTSLTMNQKLTTLTDTFDYKMEKADFNGLLIRDSIGKDYPVLNGTVLSDGKLQFDSAVALTDKTDYIFIAKIGALMYNNGAKNLAEVEYAFTAGAITPPSNGCTVTFTLDRMNPLYPTALGNLKYDGGGKLKSDNTNLAFSIDKINRQPALDLNMMAEKQWTSFDIVDLKTKETLTFTNVLYDAKNLTVRFDAVAQETIDVALSKATPTYAFEEKAVLIYDRSLAIKGEGLEISADGGKSRVSDYKAEVYPTALSVRSKTTLTVTELSKVVVDSKAGTLAFSIANKACVPPVLDADKDGVEDALDLCADTKSSDSMASLSPNSFMVQNFVRVTNAGSKNKPLTQPATFTMTDLFGCSCEQILAGKPGNNGGELKFGCSKGTIDNFIANRGRAK